MVCKNCGAQIPDGSTFCTECGAPVQQEPVQQPVQQQYTPVQEPAANDPALNAKPILICGILAVALCWTGIGGLICAIICNKKVKAYLAAGGVLAGMAKVGKILGTVGLILSILYMVFWVIYFFVVIIGVIGGVVSGGSGLLDY